MRTALAFASTLLLGACGGGDGGASLPPPGPPLVKVSAPTPFAAGCTAVSGSSTLFKDSEVEPHLAVDPGNPLRLLGAWQQDRFSDGGSRGLVTARSSDGGQTWQRTMLATSRCGGGTGANDWDRASDPWVAIAADGRAYAITLALDQSAASGDNAVLVFRSLDGGASWGAPTTLIQDTVANFNDKEAMAADPGNANYAYAGWDRLTADNRGPAMFARTIDGGATWSPATVVYDPGVGNQTLNVTPVVAPDGTLYLHFTRFLNGPGLFQQQLMVMRSDDHGAAFGAPVPVATILPWGASDPANGDPIRDGAGLGNLAVGPSGELVLVWQDSISNVDGIRVARSTDRGATWTAPIIVSNSAGWSAFTPTVAVRSDGRIGVSYFDMRGEQTAGHDGKLGIQYWLTTSNDGISWSEAEVAPPFDIRLAPVARGYFLGDYMGLATSGASFIPFFVQTNNRGTENRNDVYAMPAGHLTGADTAAAHITAKPAPTVVPDAAAQARSFAAVMRRQAARMPEGSVWQARYEAMALAADQASHPDD